jgi:hypothetical protein
MAGAACEMYGQGSRWGQLEAALTLTAAPDEMPFSEPQLEAGTETIEGLLVLEIKAKGRSLPVVFLEGDLCCP